MSLPPSPASMREMSYTMESLADLEASVSTMDDQPIPTVRCDSDCPSAATSTLPTGRAANILMNSPPQPWDYTNGPCMTPLVAELYAKFEAGGFSFQKKKKDSRAPRVRASSSHHRQRRASSSSTSPERRSPTGPKYRKLTMVHRGEEIIPDASPNVTAVPSASSVAPSAPSTSRPRKLAKNPKKVGDKL